jgi:16S rRNA (uracil1498-N3)-methyltransferase
MVIAVIVTLNSAFTSAFSIQYSALLECGVPRFYAPDFDPAARDVTLGKDESHHLTRVLRLRAGDEVSIFDGRGHECAARVDQIGPNTTTLTILHAIPSPPPPPVSVVLVQAVLKGDKMDDVVRDATMVGVAAIVPLVTERSLVSVSTLTKGRAVDRWTRVAIASAKQCGRAHLPGIDQPLSFDAWLTTPFEGQRLMFAEPASEPRPRTLREVLADATPAAIACVIGPEGGWSVAEREKARAAGCVAVTLGSMTLRADAAGLVAAAVVSFAFERS